MEATHARLCSLAAAAGRNEACPEGACPFWEPGGAALPGRCAFEQLDLAGEGELAGWLLELRALLGSADSQDGEETLRHLFRHLLNESAE